MHQHSNQRGEREDDMGSMGHGQGLKGALLMLLCCLPMIALFALVLVGLLR